MQINTNVNLSHFYNNNLISLKSQQQDNIDLSVNSTSLIQNTKNTEEVITPINNIIEQDFALEYQSSFLDIFSTFDALTLLQNSKINEQFIPDINKDTNTKSEEELFEENFIVSDSTTEAFTLEEVLLENITNANNTKTKNAIEAYTVIDNLGQTDWESVFSEFSNGDGLII